jgi:hypothetical protein
MLGTLAGAPLMFRKADFYLDVEFQLKATLFVQSPQIVKKKAICKFDMLPCHCFVIQICVNNVNSM